MTKTVLTENEFELLKGLPYGKFTLLEHQYGGTIYGHWEHAHAASMGQLGAFTACADKLNRCGMDINGDDLADFKSLFRKKIVKYIKYLNKYRRTDREFTVDADVE